MKKLLIGLSAVAVLGGALAWAQSSGIVPRYSVPLGLGPGFTGFGSAAPGASGQVLVSNGASSFPSFQELAPADFGDIAANTVLGNDTGSTGPVEALPLPSCSGTGESLNYTSGSGFGCVSPTAAGRIKLTGALQMYVATTGTDNASCGLAAITPCRTPIYAYNLLSANYDLGGQSVTINIAAGTYTNSNQVYGPMLVGQASPGSLIFSGDCSTPFSTIIRPSIGLGYAYSAAYGASFRIRCQYLDQIQQRGLYPLGADTIVAGQGSAILLGNPSLFGSGADIKFGCNFSAFNLVTVNFRGYVQVDNDISIDVTGCSVSGTLTTTMGSADLTSVTGLANNVVPTMGIAGAGIPVDAYVLGADTGAATITITCVYTTPCVASASATGVSYTASGGGQTFINPSSGSQVYFNTNGDPDFSILINLLGRPFFTAGWMFVNTQSAVNAQALTFVNRGLAGGKCPVTKTQSNIDSNFQGVPYFPCNQLEPEVSDSAVAVVAGDSTFTVSSATGIVVGMTVTDIRSTTATWSAGDSTITVADGTGIVVGMKVTGEGLLGGAVVTGVAGTTITVGGCSGSGTRCVSGRPTYLAGSGTSVIFSNGLFTGGSVVTGISGTTITISDTIKASGTAGNIWFQGRNTGYSLYD